MMHLDSVGQLRKAIESLHATYAEALNSQLKLLSGADDRNASKGRELLKRTIILFAIFSRGLDTNQPLTEIQRIEIIEEIAEAYDFARKDRPLIRAILAYMREEKAQFPT
jgi:hypothetical protein